MPRKVRSRWLERVIFRVWEAAQRSASQEEHQLHTITLRFLGLTRQGEPTSLDLATYGAFGCSFQVWRERNMGRISQMAWELAAIIPDYDPSVESESRARRSAEVRGPLYPMSVPPRPPLQKPVLPMPLPRTGTK